MRAFRVPHPAYRSALHLPRLALRGIFMYASRAMSDAIDPHDAAEAAAQEPAAPITSRFLFVDVAAQRAKQLRRGALPRIERPPAGPHKLERLAMEEVRSGAIHYTLPEDVKGLIR